MLNIRFNPLMLGYDKVISLVYSNNVVHLLVNELFLKQAHMKKFEGEFF